MDYVVQLLHQTQELTLAFHWDMKEHNDLLFSVVVVVVFFFFTTAA
jgi:hypothetical protein